MGKAKKVCDYTLFMHTLIYYTGLFISPSGTSELDCATTKKDGRKEHINRYRIFQSFFFCTRGLGVLAGSTARG